MMRQGRVQTISVTTSGAMVLPASSNRVAIIFSPHDTDKYTVSNDSGVSTAAGLLLTAGGGIVELTVERHGDVVQRAWYARSAAGGITVGIVEVVE